MDVIDEPRRRKLARRYRISIPPQRDLPIGIIATLVVCTILYIGVAVVLTGVVPWQSMLDDAAPVANSLKALTASTHSNTLRWVELGVLFGAMMGFLWLGVGPLVAGALLYFYFRRRKS